MLCTPSKTCSVICLSYSYEEKTSESFYNSSPWCEMSSFHTHFLSLSRSTDQYFIWILYTDQWSIHLNKDSPMLCSKYRWKCAQNVLPMQMIFPIFCSLYYWDEMLPVIWISQAEFMSSYQEQKSEIRPKCSRRLLLSFCSQFSCTATTVCEGYTLNQLENWLSYIRFSSFVRVFFGGDLVLPLQTRIAL